MVFRVPYSPFENGEPRTRELLRVASSYWIMCCSMCSKEVQLSILPSFVVFLSISDSISPTNPTKGLEPINWQVILPCNTSY